MFAELRNRFFPGSSQRRPRFRPQLESLENRACPTSTLSLFSPGAGQIGLLIQGDNKPDTIRIQGIGPSKTGVGAQLEVNYTGQAQAFDNVTQVLLRSGGGDDDISYGGFSGGVFINVNSGAGDDSLAFPGFQGGVRLNVNSGDGNDKISYLSAGPGGYFNLNSGDGNDTVAITFNGQMPADPSMSVQTSGSGADASVGGPAVVRVNTGQGNDALTFNGQVPADASIGLLLGAGNDAATLSGITFGGTMQFNVDAGAGNDAVSFERNTLPLVETASIAILLRSGNDRATLRDNTFAGPADLIVNAGAGNDRITFQGSLPTSIGLLLGAGNDTANLGLGASKGLELPRQLLVRGGTGDDRITTTIDAPQETAGSFPGGGMMVQLLAEAGDDRLALFVQGPLSALGNPFLLLQGGQGFDVGTASRDVALRGCERVGFSAGFATPTPRN